MTPAGSADSGESPSHTTPVYLRLLCISTAFELLSGQGKRTILTVSPLPSRNIIFSRGWPGESLNIDLSDFVNNLYAIIPFIGISNGAEDTGSDTFLRVWHTGSEMFAVKASDWSSQVQMLFHALHLIFTRESRGAPPVWRAAAFAKRLLTAALHWDPTAAIRAVEFVAGLVRKNPKLEALLTTEDRSFDGMFQPETDDPRLCHPFGTSFFELVLLERNHIDPGVRHAARALAGGLSR